MIAGNLIRQTYSITSWEMASSLELLPTEILDIILEPFTNRINGCKCGKISWVTLAYLSRSSRLLNHRIEPVLYNAPHAKDLAFRLACSSGNCQTISKAVAYAGKPGAVRLCCEYFRNAGYSYTSYRENSSLGLAVVGKQLEVFRLLLSLGASITRQDFRKKSTTDTQTKMFVDLLRRRENVAFLEAFIDARATVPYWDDDREDNYSQAEFFVSQLNFSDFVLSESITLLEKMAANGARLNEASPITDSSDPQHIQYLTPLSAACLRGDADIFNMLVTKGAREDLNVSLTDT